MQYYSNSPELTISEHDMWTDQDKDLEETIVVYVNVGVCMCSYLRNVR